MTNSSSQCGACRQVEQLFAFTMAFQPIVDLDRHAIDSHEALVRGCAGEGAKFVLDQVNEHNIYAFDQACRVKAIELAAGLKLEGGLNINFLPGAVYEPRACIRQTLLAAERTGLAPNRLTFEFIETERISDTAHTLAIVSEYRRQGFKVALDDFGTGYSGLARLIVLMPDIIKIDRFFVQDCDVKNANLAIVASLVSLAATFGIKVVAEGVERRGEMEALRSVGIRFMQGYYFGKPRFEGLVSHDEIDWPDSDDPALSYPAPGARISTPSQAQIVI
jgi:EAL domain-containing protein (putative c-di-GMP-specific phosphodiesterase class I)